MSSDAHRADQSTTRRSGEKRLRRELLRVGAREVSLYIDGPRGIARLRFPDHAGQFSVLVDEALGLLRLLSDGAGVEEVLNAIART